MLQICQSADSATSPPPPTFAGMADPAAHLWAAVKAGDAAAVAAALAAGAQPDEVADANGGRFLHFARQLGRLACVETLLEAGADPNARYKSGLRPLHSAAASGHPSCAVALLAAGADPAAVDNHSHGWTALHCAVFVNCLATVRLLLGMAPQAALKKDWLEQTPLQLAFAHSHFDAARCLLELGALPPASELLDLLRNQQQYTHPTSAAVQPLFAPLVARQSLSPSEWQQVPAPCPGLGAALPAVLRRSAEEAAQLVRCLPPADRERLRTAALCLRRVQRLYRLALPADIVNPLLLAAVAELV